MGEIENFPQSRTLEKGRHFIRLVNTDEVFVLTTRLIKIYPQVLYKQVRVAGVEKARQVCAYICSIFETGYFLVDKKGTYDNSLEGQQRRARAMLIHICQSGSSIYLGYAGPYFFRIYPELAVAAIKLPEEKAHA